MEPLAKWVCNTRISNKNKRRLLKCIDNAINNVNKRGQSKHWARWKSKCLGNAFGWSTGQPFLDWCSFTRWSYVNKFLRVKQVNTTPSSNGN